MARSIHCHKDIHWFSFSTHTHILYNTTLTFAVPMNSINTLHESFHAFRKANASLDDDACHFALPFCEPEPLDPA